jgi:ferritin-like metal-binding protein YciE
VEHYEIAGYGCVRTYANLLGESEAASLLEQILAEEKETDEKLTELAEQINVVAKEAEESEEEEAPKPSNKGSRKPKTRVARA